jgi:hypothetical protein
MTRAIDHTFEIAHALHGLFLRYRGLEMCALESLSRGMVGPKRAKSHPGQAPEEIRGVAQW